MLKDISILENKHENIIDLFFAMDDHIINTSKSIRKNPQMIENLKKLKMGQKGIHTFLDLSTFTSQHFGMNVPSLLSFIVSYCMNWF